MDTPNDDAVSREPASQPDPERPAAARDALEAATEAASAHDEPGASGPGSDSDVTDGEEGIARARQIALRQLAMGPRTRQQLADRMRDRDCEPAAIERVLDRMSEVGLVNDQAYAHMLVRTKREGSGLAARGLRHELRKKGVPEHMAEQAMQDAEPHQERAQAEALVAARLPRVHGLAREVQMRRLGGFLARKGYPPGLSLQVITDALDRAPEHLRD